MKRLTWKRIFLTFLLLIVLGFTAAILVWQGRTLGPSEIALASLRSDQQVTFTQSDNAILFEPASAPAATVFIFYPGGGVDYRSYAPLLRAVAARGYGAVALKMPLNLAFFDIEAAGRVISSAPQVKHWVVGGHSLGGVAAARYAANHPEIEGIVFWASYPADASLKSRDIRVLSISGSEDGLSVPETINASRSLLPTDALFIEIQGGNHAQFGAYGSQGGDHPALISPEEQWAQTVDASVGLLEAIEQGPDMP